MLVNVNKFKPYKYMEPKVQKTKINSNILGTECRWNSSGEFWYGRGRWRLWNT